MRTLSIKRFPKLLNEHTISGSTVVWIKLSVSCHVSNHVALKPSSWVWLSGLLQGRSGAAHPTHGKALVSKTWVFPKHWYCSLHSVQAKGEEERDAWVGCGDGTDSIEVALCLAQCMGYTLYSVTAALKWTEPIPVPVMLFAKWSWPSYFISQSPLKYVS